MTFNEFSNKAYNVINKTIVRFSSLRNKIFAPLYMALQPWTIRCTNFIYRLDDRFGVSVVNYLLLMFRLVFTLLLFSLLLFALISVSAYSPFLIIPMSILAFPLIVLLTAPLAAFLNPDPSHTRFNGRVFKEADNKEPYSAWWRKLFSNSMQQKIESISKSFANGIVQLWQSGDRYKKKNVQSEALVVVNANRLEYLKHLIEKHASLYGNKASLFFERVDAIFKLCMEASKYFFELAMVTAVLGNPILPIFFASLGALSLVFTAVISVFISLSECLLLEVLAEEHKSFKSILEEIHQENLKKNVREQSSKIIMQTEINNEDLQSIKEVLKASNKFDDFNKDVVDLLDALGNIPNPQQQGSFRSAFRAIQIFANRTATINGLAQTKIVNAINSTTIDTGVLCKPSGSIGTAILNNEHVATIDKIITTLKVLQQEIKSPPIELHAFELSRMPAASMQVTEPSNLTPEANVLLRARL